MTPDRLDLEVMLSPEMEKLREEIASADFEQN